MLDGYTVGITADRRAEELGALLRQRGAAVLHGPAIRTGPLDAEDPLRAATDAFLARAPRFLVANTGIGIRSWLTAAGSWGLDDALDRALRRTAIYARGPKASAAVHAHGLDVVARRGGERLADVVEVILTELRAGDGVAVQLDGGPRPPDLARLEAAGADVIAIPVYAWRLPDDRRPALRLAEGVVAGRVHAVTFTAGPQVSNWLEICAAEGLDRDLLEALAGGDVVVACVGPVCAAAAVAAGIPAERLVVPGTARLGPLARAVASALDARTAAVPLGGRELVLAGNVVRIGGDRVELTGTEARVLAALAARGGAVVGKDELLRTVWGAGAEDTRVVEVAVARLRRRLGPHAAAVAAIPRRGYALR